MQVNVDACQAIVLRLWIAMQEHLLDALALPPIESRGIARIVVQLRNQYSEQAQKQGESTIQLIDPDGEPILTWCGTRAVWGRN